MQLPLVVVLGFASMSATFNQRMLEPLTAVLSRALEVDVATAAMVAPAFTLPYALAQLVLGPLADSYGKVRILRISVMILLVSSVLSLFAANFNMLMALRFMAGVASGGMIPVALALIADRVGVDQRQVALSHFMSALILTQIYTPPLSAAVTQWFDWHIVFVLASLIAAVSLAFLYWQISPAKRDDRPPLSFSAATGTYRRILSLPAARLCFVGVLAESTCIFGFSPYLAPFLESSGMGGAAQAGYVLSVFGLGGIVYIIAVSRLAKRFSTFQMMHFGGVLVFIGLCVIPLARHWSTIAMAYFPIGFGFYMLHSGLQTRVTEVLPEARGSVVSLHAFFMFMGFATGPILFGWLAAAVGEKPTLYLSAIIILIVSQLVPLFLARRVD